MLPYMTHVCITHEPFWISKRLCVSTYQGWSQEPCSQLPHFELVCKQFLLYIRTGLVPFKKWSCPLPPLNKAISKCSLNSHFNPPPKCSITQEIDRLESWWKMLMWWPFKQPTSLSPPLPDLYDPVFLLLDGAGDVERELLLHFGCLLAVVHRLCPLGQGVQERPSLLDPVTALQIHTQKQQKRQGGSLYPPGKLYGGILFPTTVHDISSQSFNDPTLESLVLVVDLRLQEASSVTVVPWLWPNHSQTQYVLVR